MRKINTLNWLKIALGISIFSIGYLVTMFYFQVNDLHNKHNQVQEYYKLSNALSKFEISIELESNYLNNQEVNINYAPKNKHNKTDLYTLYLKKHENNPNFATDYTPYFNTIKASFKSYLIAKNQSVKNFSRIDFKTILIASTLDVINNSKTFSEQVEFKNNLLNDNYEKLILQTKISGFLIAFISFLLFILSYIIMNENMIRLRKSNHEILFMNETLSNAEMVAGFGSWKVNIAENSYFISDNFYRMVGLKPKECVASLEKIMSFIHPDDQADVLKLHQNSLQSKENTTISFRFILPDGSVKYIVSHGKFLHNSKGELVKIGVNQDITDLMKKSKELEEKNVKLSAINSELESFNVIVSHDLQEPLRKIQMFISRIENNEFKETASENTIGYFNKIKLSAQKMQNLMTDLVDYSRTIKDDRIFEQVELNTIFEEILEELSLRIEEKNATIFTDNLPTVLGTRFQIQQLFVNLISNALKYVKSDVAPIISIRHEVFNNAIVNEKTISSNDYHKITVSDNGIGFEQKYADKMFMLFKRLETDQSYQGTGLGLAICKKIVDNNNGYITAEGIPNQGSVFTVYLPKLTSFDA